jgi:hypothetical protein
MQTTTGKDTEFKLEFPFTTTVDVRFRSLSSLTQDDIDWLLETADSVSTTTTMAVGLDTEFDNQEISLIQIATSSRVLLIYALRKDRVKNPDVSKPLSHFLSDPSIILFGAELWYDGESHLN